MHQGLQGYRIELASEFDRGQWFAECQLYASAGTTTIVTAPIDQSGLFGLLRQVRDLGIPLLSVNPVAPQNPLAAHVCIDQGRNDYDH